MKIFPRPENPRYVFKANAYTWYDRDSTPAPGVGIFYDNRLVQHISADQALALAEQLTEAAGTTPPERQKKDAAQ